MDEIVVLRNAQNPIGQLCRQFSSFKLADLLMLVCDMGRLDVLLSLKNLVKNFNNVKNVGQKQSDVLRERYVETDSVILATSTTEVESLNSISSRDFCDEIVANPAPLILVLHHENKVCRLYRRKKLIIYF